MRSFSSRIFSEGELLVAGTVEGVSGVTGEISSFISFCILVNFKFHLDPQRSPSFIFNKAAEDGLLSVNAKLLNM